MAASSAISARTRRSSSCSSPEPTAPRSPRARSPISIIPDKPEFDDFGQMVLVSDNATGYIRVDWFTQAGLPVWGDGRLFVLGTEGTIELRKYIDIAGRPGGDHLFLVDGDGCAPRRLLGDRDHLRPAASRRHPQPDRNGDGPGALFPGDRTGSDRAGRGDADRGQPSDTAHPGLIGRNGSAYLWRFRARPRCASASAARNSWRRGIPCSRASSDRPRPPCSRAGPRPISGSSNTSPRFRSRSIPLMGYTSSSDMRRQIHLEFETREEAVAYAERNGIPVSRPGEPGAGVEAPVLFRQFQV